MLRIVVRWILLRLYTVRLVGLEHLEQAGSRVLIVANHTSLLDPVLLWAFLPKDLTFAINTHIAEQYWVRPFLRFAKVFPMDPTKPMSVKALTYHLRQNRRAVVFPEGRITVTGSLMKIYDGAGLVADKADAQVLPIRIDGAQFTPFSRLRGIVRIRWFPTITLNLLPPRRFALAPSIRGDERRKRLGMILEDLMTEMVFETGHRRRSLFSALLDARRIHGGGHIVLEDMRRKPVSYDGLIARALALGHSLRRYSTDGETVGVLLPSGVDAVATLFGLQALGRIPAMLKVDAGNLMDACRNAHIATVITSRRFIDTALPDEAIEQLQTRVRILYLEDLAGGRAFKDRLMAPLRAWTAHRGPNDRSIAERPALILFTSGAEGPPKAVALSHANVLANREQLLTKIDFNAQDCILNALPLYHSLGLCVGTLVPLLSGVRSFLYPSPLHHRIIPEIAYDIDATILFGTDTDLAGYAQHAHPYDFYSIRYVFAGAEKLRADTRQLWSDKFGIRILEGYGSTETGPVLSVNTTMHYRAETVGRFLPGIDHRLEAVPGITNGGRLHVKGPNVMLGYLSPDRTEGVRPPASCFGDGWYDTGDLVAIDDEGYVTVKGRA